MAEPVAVYAAFVASGTLLWQIVTWRTSHSISVKVDTSGYPLGKPTKAKEDAKQGEGKAQAVEDEDEEEEEDYVAVVVATVLNHTDFPIRVLGASAGPVATLTSERRLRLEGMQQLPTLIPAKDAIEIYFDRQRLDYFLGKDRALRVSVYLSTKTLRAHFSDEKRFWRRQLELLVWRIRDMRRRW